MAEANNQNNVLKELKEELSAQRKQDEALQKELANKLEASMQAFPAVSLQGDKQLAAAVKESRDGIREAIQKLADAETERQQQLLAAEVENTTAIKEAELAEENKPSLYEALQAFLGQDFKEKFYESLKKIPEGLKNFGEKFKEFGKSIATGIGDKARGIVDFITTIAKIIGAAIGFMSFLEGWGKAEKWFGENADIWDRISSGIAAVIGTFFGLDEKAQKEWAYKIDSIFDAVGGVLQGIITTVKGIANADLGVIMEGVDKIVDSMGGALNTALAGGLLVTLFAPKFGLFITKTLFGWVTKLLAMMNPIGMGILVGAAVVGLFWTFKDDIVKWIEDTFNFEFPSLADMGAKFTEWVDSVKAWFDNVLPDASTIGAKFEEWIGGIATWFDDALPDLGALATDLGNKIQEHLVDPVMGLFGNIGDLLMSGIKKIPGGEKLLSMLGFGEESDKKKNDKEVNVEVASEDSMKKIEELEKKVLALEAALVREKRNQAQSRRGGHPLNQVNQKSTSNTFVASSPPMPDLVLSP